ncbi:chromosome partitioning protein ParA [Vibrio sp. 10N.286.49.B3]|uniref:AAA family ATPase n=1 Tax=Vibrio sp. 10N.286.49.B3 TaxID=1880855 RepID=UPI000C81666A|nr:chromosome partitioning protein ParA [Vibrio sp. 10N.286.49.B3]PMH46707.1 chromosome partitioning protein ParA [Vibrio sp. 10N.286.49.B3]
MFDLVDLLKKETTNTASGAEGDAETKLTSVLFNQTTQCRELVSEAFRFEGISLPAILNNSDSEIKQHVRESTIEIVIVELNLSDNVTEDMERIRHLLPNHASVVVIGSEDAISTIRNLKAMGFYYLFWPISKQELIDFIINVNDNRFRNSGLGKNRRAKKVAVWGAKGGVGASLLTAEIASDLSVNKNSSCVIVDHQFSGGNLDILLGLSRFEKKAVSPGVLSNSLDVTYAMNMTKKVNEMLSLLAIESEELNEFELKDYVRTLSNELAVQSNFILEDLSSSSHCQTDIDYIATECEMLLLIIEPTVSCLRQATRFLSDLDKRKSNVRCFKILNYTLPEKYATVTKDEIEKYIRQKIDVVCPHEPKLNQMVLEGNHLYDHQYPLSQSLTKITALLLGQDNKFSQRGFMKRLMRRR